MDFGDDFHSQHSSSNKYDMSFSFNRVCLKRPHQAMSAPKDSSLHDVLFPKPNTASSSLTSEINTLHLHRIIEGPVSVTSDKLSATGTAIQQAILKICLTSPRCRILICAPTNQPCDSLVRSVQNQIPQAKHFRGDYDLVHGDITPQSLYEWGSAFTCPSLCELQNFKAITSTYVSSLRLHTAGVKANHFTHVFLVDASSAVEPGSSSASCKFCTQGYSRCGYRFINKLS